MNDELYFGMPGNSRDYEDDCDEGDKRDIIPTTSRQGWDLTELERIDLGTGNLDRYEGGNGNDADTNLEEETLLADDESTQNVEDWGHSTRVWRLDSILQTWKMR